MSKDIDITNRLLKDDNWSGYTQFKKFVGSKSFEKANVRIVFASVAPVAYQPFYFGANIVMSVANSIDDVFVDKSLYFFDVPCKGFVSQQPIGNFDIVGISMYMPFQIFGLPHYLAMNGLHPLAKERKKLPLVVAGGQLFAYFHLLWDFVDVICIGEGEKFIEELINVVRKYKKRPKNKILSEIAKIQGALIPAFYQKNDTMSPITSDAPYPVIKTYLKPEDFARYSIHNENKLIAKRSKLVVELARGCRYQCSFCLLARQMYPYREKNLQDVLTVVNRGRKKIPIYPFAPDEGSVSWRNELAKYVVQKGRSIFKYNFRLNTFNEEDASFIRKIVSFGLDGISPRILRVVSKCVTFDQLFEAAKVVFEQNIAVLKLNLVISFPFEDEQDWLHFRLWLNDLVDLRDSIQKTTRTTTIELHPTPFTPLHWTPMFFLPANYDVSHFLRIFEDVKLKTFATLKKLGYPQLSIQGLQNYENWLLHLFLGRGQWLANEFVWFAYLRKNITPKFTNKLMQTFYQFARQKKISQKQITAPLDPERPYIFDFVDWSGGNFPDPAKIIRNQYKSFLTRFQREFNRTEIFAPNHRQVP